VININLDFIGDSSFAGILLEPVIIIELMKKPTISETIDEMKERFTIEALKVSKGNRHDAAKLLGISERTVYHNITKYNIKKHSNDSEIN